MGFLEIILLSLGLSMDSFAVSVSCGAGMKRFAGVSSVKIILTLAIFQSVLLLLGWVAGEQFKSLIESVDHWIAFGLLVFLGGKMILESVWKNGFPARQNSQNTPPWQTKTLLYIALATSIDALAVGISFSLLNGDILLAAAIVFFITLSVSLAGIVAGLHFGRYLRRWAELLGGFILMGIGLKILLEHLYFQ